MTEENSHDMIAAFERFGTPTICEAMGRRGHMDSEIRSVWKGARTAGPALTVQCHVGDNLTIHKAIAIAREGDVLVVNAGRYRNCGLWGEIMSLAAQKKGVRGLVVSGAVRDVQAVERMRFPVFSMGLNPYGSTKNSLGPINQPIVCGEVLVNPRDIIVGDDDGVVVVPKHLARDVLMKCQEREKKEERVRELIEQGKTTLEIYGLDKVIESISRGQ
jgi:4-hydroxy-4-methyl-2-oxoglutarate aldolase